jgi:hypothetical protein
VTAMIALLHDEVWSSWRGCSNKEMAGPLGANQFLVLRSVEQACEAGCRCFERGESGGVASLEQFKSRLGGKKEPVTGYRLKRVPLTRSRSRVDDICEAGRGRKPS